jgi:hypothetical protein
MSKVLSVSRIFISTLIIILSLSFIFIEARLILAGDFLIYNNAFNGFIRYFFRLILSILSLLVALYEIINIKKKDEKIKEYLIYGSISLVLMSIVISFFSSNYVGLVLIVLSSLFLLNKLLLIKIK